MKSLSTLSLFFVLAFSSTAKADFITGQVVDSNGFGIPGIDIDVKNLGGGGNPTIFNDGTDAGGFFNTTVPNGIYRVTFTPPQVASSLVLEIENVVVVGTTVMGVITLDPGIAVSGRFVTELAIPISGINVDAVVVSTGQQVDPLPMDVSDAFGQFTVIVPNEAVELEIKPSLLSGLAPLSVPVDSLTPVALGDLTLRPGFLLTAFLRNASTLAPLTLVDLDVVNVVTKETVFTPGDNSNLGVLDVTLPTGVYDLEFRPIPGSGLAPKLLPSVVFAGPLNLGNVDLEAGISLFGTITDSMGLPLTNVDIDLNDSVTGVSILLTTGDNTDGSGAYSVLAPAGTYDATFTAPAVLGLADLVLTNIVLNTPTQLNGTMAEFFSSICNGDGGNQAGCSDCPCSNNAPIGTVGGCLNSAGTSTKLTASGDPSASLPPGVSTDLRLTLNGAPSGAFCLMLSGSAIAPQNAANMCFGMVSGLQSPDRDGLRCAVMNVKRHGGRAANALGEVMSSSGPSRVWGGEAQPGGGLWKQGGFVSGQTRYFQVTYREDTAAVCMRGLNTSQAVEVTFTP